jgi:hypothetical protein
VSVYAGRYPVKALKRGLVVDTVVSGTRLMRFNMAWKIDAVLNKMIACQQNLNILAL